MWLEGAEKLWLWQWKPLGETGTGGGVGEHLLEHSHQSPLRPRSEEDVSLPHAALQRPFLTQTVFPASSFPITPSPFHPVQVRQRERDGHRRAAPAA